MFSNERQETILEILRENKSAEVKLLAKNLYVSEATVRRDLREMQKMGLLERSHGGAVLPESADEVSIFFRINKNAKEKERAATVALKILPEFKTLFVDSSSTALALAGRIDLAFKTVVTNNLQTAMTLAQKSNANVIMLGGNVQCSTGSVTSGWTAKQLDEFAFDLSICSCNAVMNGETYERSLDQKEIKCAAMKRSRTRLLIFDHTKFSQTAMYKTASLRDYEIVVSDEKPPKNAVQSNVNVVFDEKR